MKIIIQTIILILFAQIANGQADIEFAEIRPPYKSISPIVEKLLKDKISTDDLWLKVKQSGLPIIENDPLYADYVWATLILKDTTQNKKISFEVFGIYEEYRFGDMQMHKLKNTDLYYRSYMIPNDLCFSYRFRVEDTISNKITRKIDNFNPNRIPTGSKKKYSYSVLDLRSSELNLSNKIDSSFITQVDKFSFKSKLLNNERNISVYLPQNYDKKAKNGYPIIYLFDSFVYLNKIQVPNILDNLIDQKKIQPMIAVFIDNPTKTSRKTELPINSVFKEAIITELVPMINKRYNVTSRPEKTIVGGASYGGLAATYIGFYHPDIFGRILSQSGSFWRDRELSDIYGNEIRNDWMINQFIIEDKKPLKIFLDWGLQENLSLIHI